MRPRVFNEDWGVRANYRLRYPTRLNIINEGKMLPSVKLMTFGMCEEKRWRVSLVSSLPPLHSTCYPTSFTTYFPIAHCQFNIIATRSPSVLAEDHTVRSVAQNPCLQLRSQQWPRKLKHSLKSSTPLRRNFPRRSDPTDGTLLQ